MSNPLLPWRVTYCGPSVHIISADGHEIAEVVWRHEDPSKDEVAALVIEAAWLAHEVGPKVTALIEAADDVVNPPRNKLFDAAYLNHLVSQLRIALAPFLPPPPGALPVVATQPAADPNGAGAHPSPAPAACCTGINGSHTLACPKAALAGDNVCWCCRVAFSRYHEALWGPRGCRCMPCEGCPDSGCFSVPTEEDPDVMAERNRMADLFERGLL